MVALSCFVAKCCYLCTALTEKRYMVPVVQLVRASDCGSECRGFESHRAPQKKKEVIRPLFSFGVPGGLVDIFLVCYRKRAHFIRLAALRDRVLAPSIRSPQYVSSCVNIQYLRHWIEWENTRITQPLKWLATHILCLAAQQHAVGMGLR